MTWGVDDATVTFGHTVALDRVDLDVPGGSVSSVVGGDGAGKTTLARMLVGLVRPVTGRVNRPQTDKIGYQSETSGVWNDLTVSENLDFVASAHRLAGAERRARSQALLEITQLGSARDRLAGRLSGGMRQKLGVAMALLPRPELLILDEPTTGLDPVSRTDLWSLIAGAASDGTAVMITTTYLDEAARGSRVLALDQGRSLASGSVSEVQASTPGVVVEFDTRPTTAFSWRRGRRWRAWFPDGRIPDGAVRVDADLSDLVTVAALERRGTA